MLRDYVRDVIAGKQKGILAFSLRVILWILSIPYGLVVRCQNWLYDCGFCRRDALPRPVISVGNLTWGGTGKTPLVQALASELLQKGFRPAILLRGYMPAGTWRFTSDEALLLEKNLPGVAVLVGKNRFKAAQDFLQTGNADIFILDDGFQHRRLKRDLDIVVLDAQCPFGNGKVLPAGILREFPAALRRADYFVVTRSTLSASSLDGLRQELSKWNPGAPVAPTLHAPDELRDLGSNEIVPLGFLRGKKVAMLCAIGEPQGFRETLQSLAALVASDFIYGDHHVYQLSDIAQVLATCRKDLIPIIVTTEKDAVKLKNFVPSFKAEVRVLVLTIHLEFVEGKEELFARIFSLL